MSQFYRERILVVGGTGTGKTLALFSIIEKVMAETSRHVYFLSCEGGAQSFLKRIPPEALDRWHYYTAYNFLTAYDAMSEIIQVIDEGDWLMIDREDFIWPWSQQWFEAETRGIPEPEVIDAWIERRVKEKGEERRLRAAGDVKTADAVRMRISSADFTPRDWALLKAKHEAITFLPYSTRFDVIGANIMMTATVSPIQTFTDRKDNKPQPEDVHDLATFGIQLDGWKPLESCARTVVLLRKRPNYTMVRVKDDDDRKWSSDGQPIPLDYNVGFLLTYQGQIGDRLQVVPTGG